jgi:amidase
MSRWATTKAAERAVRRGERIADAIDERLLTDADVLVLPVMPRISPEVGLLGDSHAVRAQLLTIPYVANTAIFNVSGHPAISVPSGRDEHGIPIGVQLVARRGREDVLLALAGQLERAGHA